MPPANSPTYHLTASSTPVRSRSPASYLPELSGLGTPVPDLASTLTLEAEDDADADNVSFLRTPISTSNLHSVHTRLHGNSNGSHSRMLSTSEQSLSSEARDQRIRDEHARPLLDPLDTWSEGMRSSAAPAGRSGSGIGTGSGIALGRSPYGVQAPNQQSLYDWAPATEEGEEEELEEIMAELRHQQPNTHPDILRVHGRAQLDSQNEMRTEAGARSHRRPSAPNATQSQSQQPHEPSLRSAAILQSVRRNRQLSARSRDLMQRYVMDRERVGNETEDRDRSNSSAWFRVAANANDTHRWEQNRQVWQASQRTGGDSSSSTTREARTGETLEALRRRYLDDPNNLPSRLESIIRVLDRVRSPHPDVDEVQKLAKKGQQQASGNGLDRSALTTLSRGLKPPPSSWLSAGTIFSGYQQAAPMPINGVGPAPLQAASNESSRTTSATTPGSDGIPATRLHVGSSNPNPVVNPTTLDKDRWAVRVAIHAVDYESMTLQGTMEAYNVPWIPTPQRISALRSTGSTTSHTSTSQPQPDFNATTQSRPTSISLPAVPPPTLQKTTFSTYLEGELLDFATHTLLTTTHTATPSDDAQYWRRLAPFSALPDHQLATCLLNPDWLERELRNKYVLMRWKERCFVRGCLVGRESGEVGTGNPAGLDTVQGITAAGLETIHRVPNPEASLSAGNENAAGRGHSMQAGYGLSISGFYYVSMRRNDGHVEGLYFDPASSPYQHLDLRPEGNGKIGKGAWEFA